MCFHDAILWSLNVHVERTPDGPSRAWRKGKLRQANRGVLTWALCPGP